MEHKINTDSWPVVTIQIDSDISVAAMKHLLEQWSGWLDKGEPFGMLFFFEASENNHSKEIKKMRKEWIKRHRLQVSRTMAGVGMIVKSSVILNMLKPIADTVAKKMFGCTARVFNWSEEDKAMQWIKEQIRIKIMNR